MLTQRPGKKSPARNRQLPCGRWTPAPRPGVFVGTVFLGHDRPALRDLTRACQHRGCVCKSETWRVSLFDPIGNHPSALAPHPKWAQVPHFPHAQCE